MPPLFVIPDAKRNEYLWFGLWTVCDLMVYMYNVLFALHFVLITQATTTNNNCNIDAMADEHNCNDMFNNKNTVLAQMELTVPYPL